MVKLELWDKNWALLTDRPIELEAEHVPRVGEIIEIGNAVKLASGTPTTFIVVDAFWENVNGKLVPRLKCHRWLAGDRYLELEEHGWVRGYTEPAT